MSPEKLARIKEYQVDFCALCDDDFQNPNFNSWNNNYRDYIEGGLINALGGQHPPHRPPV